MKQRPFLVVKPIRSSVTKGDSVTVNCYVSNKDEAYLRNNTAIKICYTDNDTNVPSCSGIDPYNETCNFTIVTNTSLICGLGNCSHIGQSSFFTVAKEGKIHPSIFSSTYIYILFYQIVHLKSAWRVIIWLRRFHYFISVNFLVRLRTNHSKCIKSTLWSIQITILSRNNFHSIDSDGNNS